MLNCAYCDKACQPTREHVIPDWYNDTPGEAETFSARAPLTHLQGDLLVKDVCGHCNNVVLSKLDAYGKQLYERYFANPVYAGETVTFDYDGDRLLRWLLKLSYNSARAQNADALVLQEYRKVMLGEAPMSDRVRCWLHLVTPTYFDPATEDMHQAKRDEQGHPNVDEPLWFRIGQSRLTTHPALMLVQRAVVINSFSFTLLIARADVEWPCADFDEWCNVFTSTYPDAQPVKPEMGTLTVTTGEDHTVLSILPTYTQYPTRFSDEKDPFVEQSLKAKKDAAPVAILSIPRELIEAGDVFSVAAVLHDMVSSREKAAAFRHRVAVMVNGYDHDPREIWQFPEAKQFLRSLFEECPFVMLLAHPEGSLLKLLAACWIYEEGQTDDAEQERTNEFLDRCFDGLNALNHTLMLSEEQNREICREAAKVLFGEAPPF
ncbi:Uncharacterized protein OS=Escherichia fergusonii B253 GN=ERIG_01105 PE=4 SV=1 [Gemmata massiliana]|uniref:Uncharacterized protein n=1 Tax=Gemmata massiliana TaxID=1210884 RepID=A0A6P2CZ13_9BACT|nr:hypothetical protein [Gemmata massiliana]VTR93365.1 Uncharacterized protein OS=Escherichia fergusonii B253 GN=ERIG_01105 PE=4 SV=1 [Gemmata massiliana]